LQSLAQRSSINMLAKLVLFSLFTGLFGMKCYEGMCGIHGIPCPPSLETKDCPANSCAKVAATIDGVSAGGWSCGAANSQTSGCVSGVDPGVSFDIGDETLKDASTCFCGSELCNDAAFSTATSTTLQTTLASVLLLFASVVLI